MWFVLFVCVLWVIRLLSINICSGFCVLGGGRGHKTIILSRSPKGLEPTLVILNCILELFLIKWLFLLLWESVCLSVCAGNEPRVMFSLSLSVDVLEQCLDIDMELTLHEPESQKELETWCPSSLLLLLSVYRASFPVSVTHAVFVCVCVRTSVRTSVTMWSRFTPCWRQSSPWNSCPTLSTSSWTSGWSRPADCWFSCQLLSDQGREDPHCCDGDMCLVSGRCSCCGTSSESLSWSWRNVCCRVYRTPTGTTPDRPTSCRPSARTSTR